MFWELLKEMRQVVQVVSGLQSTLTAINKRLDGLAKEQSAQTKLLHEILDAVVLPAATSAILSFDMEGKHIEGEHIKMKVPHNAQGTLTVTLKNKTGGPGRVDGIPTWSTSVDGVVEITAAADGLTCIVKTLPVSADEVKSAIVTFSGDGDLGDGVVPVVATFTATVYDPDGGAVIAEITASAFIPIS